MSEITVNAGAPAPERPQRMNAADEPMSHYVSPAPFDPYSVDIMTAEQERFYRASQWRLMWMRFRRHRVAVASGALLLVFYAATWYLFSLSIGLLFAATSFVVALIVTLLEVLITALQAFIFTTLTAFYIADAMESAH